MTAAGTGVESALAAVAADLPSLGKTDTNQAQRFNYRGVDAVVNAVGPLLRKHGLIVYPVFVHQSFDTITTAKGTVMGHAIVTVTYEWAIEGSTLQVMALGEAFDAGDKAIPKAMSVAYRTMFLQTLCLPTDEPDPDGQSFTREHGKLVDETVETTKAATRGTPDAGEWGGDLPQGADKPTQAQSAKMWAALGDKYDLNDKAQMGDVRAMMGSVVGRKIVTSKQLTRAEVGMVLAYLEGL